MDSSSGDGVSPAGQSNAKPSSPRIERLYRKKAHKLNKQLYGELSKNVDLHNRYNRAVSILKKVNSENQDLLAALVGTAKSDLDLAPAPPVSLTREQLEMFEILNS